MVVNLDRLPAGTSATVVRFEGGHGLLRKLDSMGVRPGKKVCMVSSQFMAGPVTVLVDRRQVAMGRGIAQQIVVETEG